MPSEFAFIGSNDEECEKEANWTNLCEASFEQEITSLSEERGCQVHEQVSGNEIGIHDSKFRCLGIKISKVSRDRFASVCALRFWVWD